MKKVTFILVMVMVIMIVVSALAESILLPGSKDGLYDRDPDQKVTKLREQETRPTDWVKVFEKGWVVYSKNVNHAIKEGLGAKEIEIIHAFFVDEENQRLVEVAPESMKLVLSKYFTTDGVIRKGEVNGVKFWTVNCEVYNPEEHTEVFRAFFTDTEYISVFRRNTDNVLTLCEKRKDTTQVSSGKPVTTAQPVDPGRPPKTNPPTAVPVDPGRPPENTPPAATNPPAATPVDPGRPPEATPVATNPPAATPVVTPAPTNPLAALPVDPGRNPEPAKPAPTNPLAALPVDPGRNPEPASPQVALPANPLLSSTSSGSSEAQASDAGRNPE